MKNTIISIISKTLNLSTNQISDDLGVGDIPEWDSSAQHAIVTEIETNFNIKFSVDDLLEMETVTDIIAKTQEKS